MRKWLLVIPLMIVFFMTPAAGAKDVVTWLDVNWPPFQILSGDLAGKGRFDILMRLFQDRLPQYEHRNVEMKWARFWDEVKAGEHVLNPMAIKTDERCQYAEFSEVITFTLPHRVIMKKSTLKKLGNPESISLVELLQDERVKGILQQSRSYSPELDEILAKQPSNTNVERKPLDTAQILKMILSGRTDYTIEYPFVVNYLQKTQGLESNEPLGSIEIKELPQYVTACVAGPKNVWGKQFIKDFNEMFDKFKGTDDNLKILQMWHSDPRELALIEQIYKKLFVDVQ